MKIGIAICAYNRSPDVIELVDAIRTKTKAPYELVVCDDGSKDSTVRSCVDLDIAVVTGSNRGVAWNKNRGLYWLLNRTDSSHILIIEDDMIVINESWESDWVAAIDKWGHVNWANLDYMRPRMDRNVSGDGTIENPFLAQVMTGCLMGFSRCGLEQVGYFDTNFRGYGFEHIELSRRFRRAGMGVVEKQDTEGNPMHLYVSIEGGMAMKSLPSPADKSVVNANRDVYERVRKEKIYRDPWIDDVEKAILSTEIDVAVAFSRK